MRSVLKETGRQANQKLSREILLIFLISVATGLAVYFFLLSMAGPIVWNYCEVNHISLESRGKNRVKDEAGEVGYTRQVEEEER